MKKHTSKYKFCSVLCCCLGFISLSVANDVNVTMGLPKLFATVGGDGACDYILGNSKIQDALDSGINYDEIRLASNTSYTENLFINDRNINIRGGYVDCQAAAVDDQDTTQYTLINGDLLAGIAVVSILGDGERSNMLLENIEIKNGTGSGLLSGGIATFRADLSLRLNRVRINNNFSSNLSGGLNVYTDDQFFGSNTDVEGIDVSIASNTGAKGGGFYCGGTANRITLSGISGVALNQAVSSGPDTGHGGGGYIERSCYFTNYSGQESGNIATLFNGIIANNAAGEGGGLYLRQGSRANLIGSVNCDFDGNCIGSDLSPANVTANTAIGDGGGIFATGLGTSVQIDNGLINNNETSGNGGGLFVADQASVYMSNGLFTDLQKQCWSPGECSQLTANKANNYGGGSYVESAGIISLDRTVISSNRANFGTAAYVRDENSKVWLRASMVIINGDFAAGDYDDNFVFRTLDAGNATGFNKPAINLIQTTVADNRALGSVIGNANGQLNVFNSIISDAPTVLYTETGNDPFIILDCNVLHEVPLINQGSNEDSVVADPVFIDRANGDFHLNAEFSPAVDLCEIAASSISHDIDSEPFNYDDPFVKNTSSEGAYDAGADETLTSDVIFANGF